MAICRLVSYFGNPKEALEADNKALKRVDGLSSRAIKSLGNYRPEESEIVKDIETMKRLDVKLLTFNGEDYPEPLKHIHNPPAMLFIRGRITSSDDRSVAVVGMRNPSRYGLEMTETISKGLAQEGFTLVSGLARGVDTACHRAALKYDGRTIGVLGCGIDVVYPRENRVLIEEIVQRNSAIITEFRPGTSPHANNFPGRNRIVSGLSKGVLVVEASDRSGSLITAEHALDQNRDVFAVPGNVLSVRSKGPHKLIKQGAGLVESAKDIIESIESAGGMTAVSTKDIPAQTAIPFGLSESQIKVMDALEMDPIPMDTLSQYVNMEVGPLAALLLEMEIAGLVRRHPGKMFSRMNK